MWSVNLANYGLPNCYEVTMCLFKLYTALCKNYVNQVYQYSALWVI